MFISTSSAPGWIPECTLRSPGCADEASTFSSTLVSSSERSMRGGKRTCTRTNSAPRSSGLSGSGSPCPGTLKLMPGMMGMFGGGLNISDSPVNAWIGPIAFPTSASASETAVSVAMSSPAERKRVCGSAYSTTLTSPGTIPGPSSPSNSKMNCVPGRMPGLIGMARWQRSERVLPSSVVTVRSNSNSEVWPCRRSSRLTPSSTLSSPCFCRRWNISS
mmetsp:Transcript_63156/g.95318  ORF Transcript_63156/g.95318 Transcript_63156/m.95318 type:complete len:218 (-) Transcript_63156:289-942(-)